MQDKPLTEKQLTVLLAASDVFLENGFSAATTDMIQQRAGVSKATVYAYCTSKEALFSAVIEHQCANMARAVRSIRPVSGDLQGTLRKLGYTYLSIIFSQKGLALYRVVIGECQRFPALGHIFWQGGPATIADMVEEHLLSAVQAGELSLQRTGSHLAARQFVSLLRGERYSEYLTHPAAVPTDVQIERWVDQAVETFLLAYRCQE